MNECTDGQKLGYICGSAQSMDCADPQIAPNIYISEKVCHHLGVTTLDFPEMPFAAKSYDAHFLESWT